MLPSTLVESEKMGCTRMGGVASDVCPTTDLLGCCHFSDHTTTCYYTGPVDAKIYQGICDSAKGAWDTSP